MDVEVIFCCTLWILFVIIRCSIKILFYYVSAICSFDDHVQKLIPVCWLEPTKTHCETLDLFDYPVLDIVFFLLFLLVLTEFDLKQALFYQVVVIEGAAHLSTALFIVLSQGNKLPILTWCLIKHVGVEERTDVFVVALQRFQDQKRRDNEEDLRFPVLQLLGELLMFLSCCLDHWREMDQLVAFLMIHKVS